jgi:hypothetical protein
MKRSVFVRVATLLLSLTGLVLAILHGCSRPASPTAQTPTNAAASSASEAAPADPAYLGATKAAVVVPPKQATSAQK